jgi:hypothetical protein
MLLEPAYFRVVDAPIAPRGSLIKNVWWLCQPCYEAFSEDERSTWLARQAPQSESKSKWRSALFPWLRRKQGQ